MTAPIPHHSEAIAASLDALRVAIDLPIDDARRGEQIVVATQAVYAAGLNALLGTVSTMLTSMAQQIEQIQQLLSYRPETQVHELRNKVQGLMDSTILMRENAALIEEARRALNALEAALAEETEKRQRLTERVEAIERELEVGR